MNIAFWDNCLCERGTSLGLYNYAYYNETILNNKSFIFYDRNHIHTKQQIVEKFKKRFIVHDTDNFKEVDQYLKEYKITHIFIIKAGNIDSRISKVAKNCIQCVFNCFQPHGDVYCSIHEYIQGNFGKYPVIPRIITLPDSNNNLRQTLNIPDNATVIGGYGAETCFDIKYVQDIVYKVAQQNSTIYFLFANFNRFCPSIVNIIHLPMIVEHIDKTVFINSCDAMLWARSDGETFGQAIAEFSIQNKPVFVTQCIKHPESNMHMKLLGDKSIQYDCNNLEQKLLNFDKMVECKKDWNAYREYSPENVMKTFENVFLNEINISTIQNLPNLNNEESQYIDKMKGLMSQVQYKNIAKIIKFKSPCNVLVFGLGNDSYLWKKMNNNGTTLFIENYKDWINKFPDLSDDIVHVDYTTTVLDYPDNLSESNLFLSSLPRKVLDIKWDVIIVDSPVGHNPPCKNCDLCSIDNPAPGRMSSIYTASKIIKNNGIIIIDDINRQIENDCSVRYFPNGKILYNDQKLLIKQL